MINKTRRKMNSLLVITVLMLLFELNDAAAINEQEQENKNEFKLCDPPPCTDDQINTLWPHHNKTIFYQCAPHQTKRWAPVEMPCGPETVFGFEEQVCIWERDWIDPCDGSLTTNNPSNPTETDPTDTESTDTETTGTGDHSSTGSEEITNETEPSPSSSEKPTETTPTTEATKTPSPTTVSSTNPSTEPTTASSQPSTESSSTSSETTSACTTEPSTTLPPPIEMCPSPNCTNDQVHALWSIKDEPTKYYQCMPDKNKECTWNTETKQCDDEKYFDYIQQECVDPSEWKDVCNEYTSSSTASEPPSSTGSTTESPEEDLCEKPMCTDDQTHVLWPSYEGAAKYWQCIPKPDGKWEATLQTCENEQLFSYSKQSCADPEQWEDVCGGLATTETIEEIDEEEEEEPKRCAPPKCKVHTDKHRLWPAFDPRFYYVCKAVSDQEYRPHMIPCPKDEYFSDEKQACVDPCDWRYSCGPDNITYPAEPVTAAGPMSTTIDPGKETTTNSPTEASTESVTDSLTATTQKITTEAIETQTSTTESSTTEVSVTESQTVTSQPTKTEEPTTEIQSTTTEIGTNSTPEMSTDSTTDLPTTTTQRVTTQSITEGVTSTTEIPTTLDPTTKNPPTTIVDQTTGFQAVTNTESQTEAPTSTTSVATTIDQSSSAITEETTTQLSSTVTQSPTVGCIVPECGTDLQRNTLWPDKDPNFYLQCAPAEECGWAPIRRPCAKGTWFSYANQTCVFPCDWVDPCQNTNKTTPLPTTAVDTTTRTTTKLPVTPTTSKTTITTKSTTTKKATTVKPQETTKAKPTATSEPVAIVSASSMKVNDTCIPVNCETDEGRQILYPHPDNHFYIQCSPSSDEWIALTRPCGPGTVFNYSTQVCVWPEEWQDPCSNQTGSPTPSQPTTGAPTKFTTTKKPPTTRTTTSQKPPKTTTDSSQTIDVQESCIPPVCNTDADRIKLYPHPDKAYYYQCVPTRTGFQPLARPCAPGTAFSWKLQVCVHEYNWEDPCSSSSSRMEPPKKLKKGYHYPKKYNKEFHWV